MSVTLQPDRIGDLPAALNPDSIATRAFAGAMHLAFPIEVDKVTGRSGFALPGKGTVPFPA